MIVLFVELPRTKENAMRNVDIHKRDFFLCSFAAILVGYVLVFPSLATGQGRGQNAVCTNSSCGLQDRLLL
jgi:hypothetical protein